MHAKSNAGVAGRGAAVLCALALCLSAASMARATSIPVTSTADDTTLNGNCTLREAVLAANGDTAVDACPAGNGADVITVPAGTYVLTLVGAGEDAAATGDLDITEDVEIEGAGADAVVIDGNSADRVFDFDPGDSGISAVLSGVTVQHGGPVPDGGGIRNSGDLTVADSTVTANVSSSNVRCCGGGICNYRSLAVIRSAVSQNRVVTVVPGNPFLGIPADGGGIGSFGTTTVTDSTLDANTMGFMAGPIFGSLLRGGGISSRAPLTVTGSTISNNVLDIGMFGGGNLEGGGIFSMGGLDVSNSTITGNHALEMSPVGVAIAGGVSAGTAAFSNATVIGNSGAAPFGNNILLGGATSFRNSIVGDCYPFDSAAIVADAYNIEDGDTCGFSGTDQINVNPMLGPLQDNGGPTFTRLPQSGSPALNAGSPAAPGSGGTACEVNDQRGVGRPQSFRCDVGSVEGEPCPLLPRSDCSEAGRSLLLIKDRDADGATAKDKLIWKWQNGAAAMQSDFGDPTGSGYGLPLCVYATGQRALTAAIPGGDTCGASPCWKTVGSLGYRRRDPAAAADGIAKVILKGGAVTKITVKGKGAGLDLDAGTLPLNDAGNVIIQLSTGANANCWQSTFPGSAIQRNDDALFKAKAP